jgi:hypothetical protein
MISYSRGLLNPRLVLILVSVFAFILLLITGTHTGRIPKLSLSYNEKPTQPSNAYAGKPESQKVIALVFYGRREFVEILDCYLMVCFPSIFLLTQPNSYISVI